MGKINGGLVMSKEKVFGYYIGTALAVFWNAWLFMLIMGAAKLSQIGGFHFSYIHSLVLASAVYILIGVRRVL